MADKKERIFPVSISREEAKDTGMAFVLVCLLLAFFKGDILFAKIAASLLVVDMIVPTVFKYPAFLWLGLSRLIGRIVSRIILTVVFFLVVTPTGLLRRALGRDSLKLRGFKKSKGSVMVERSGTLDKGDLERPW